MTVDNPSLLAHRPIPTLREWLGDGSRAPAFEEWVRENLAVQELDLTEEERAASRIIKTMAIASIESMRIEDEHGRDPFDSTVMLARAAGWACMAAVACLLREGPNVPVLKVAKLFAAEFEAGAKQFARSEMKSRAAQSIQA